MTVFLWEGADAQGKKLSGEIEARTQQAAFTLLRSQKIIPDVKSIKEKGKGLNFEIKIPGFGPKVKGKDVVLFTRQFATMVDAGLPMVQAIDILIKGAENKAFKKVLQLKSSLNF